MHDRRDRSKAELGAATPHRARKNSREVHPETRRLVVDTVCLLNEERSPAPPGLSEARAVADHMRLSLDIMSVDRASDEPMPADLRRLAALHPRRPDPAEYAAASTRSLAEDLKVGRNTVIAAYDQLLAEGLSRRAPAPAHGWRRSSGTGRWLRCTPGLPPRGSSRGGARPSSTDRSRRATPA